MSTHATSNDVAARLGRTLTPAETALVDVRLGDVERKLRKRIPDLDDQIAAGSIDQDDVIQVESDVVLRVARNPEGYSSETDGNYAYEFSREVASGKLTISAEDWETLGVHTTRMTVLTPYFGVPA